MLKMTQKIKKGKSKLSFHLSDCLLIPKHKQEPISSQPSINQSVSALNSALTVP